MTTAHRLIIAPILALVAVLSSGCERAFFGYVNRNLPPPDASVEFAPERSLSLDVYRPRGNVGAAPTVVFFYGGAWKRGAREQYQFVGHRLAENGVLAIVADYRTWPRAGFPAFMDDAADAVAWARTHAADYGGDPHRLFLAGHSAGAQIAGLLGTDRRYLSARGIEPAQLAGVIGLSGPYDFNVGSKYAAIFGPPSRWPQAQVVNFVDGDEPPFLLVHGSEDRVVEVRDSIQLAERLRAAQAPATLVLLPDAGHSAPLTGFYAPKKAPTVLPAILDFIATAPSP
jgi:acetyl esterase/lipase